MGKLKQALGWTRRTVTSAGGAVNSITEWNNTLYYSEGSTLYSASGTVTGGFDGSPLGLLPYLGFLWIINRSLQKRFDGVTLYPWSVETPSAPSAPGTTGGDLVDGVYDYYVTFIDSTLSESNPSPVTAVTFSGGTDDGVVTVARPTASTPALILRWNVYRKSPGTSVAYKLNQGILAYATDLSFVDDGTITDDDLIGNNEEMEEDHDAAPAARVIANQPFNDRLVVASSAAYPNRLWYTKSRQPAYFPTDNYIDVGPDSSDAILFISVKKGHIIIYRERSIWWQVGDFDDENARCEPLVPEMGVDGIRAVAATSAGDFFKTTDGVYRLTDWARKVSQKVEPIFYGGFDTENYTLMNLQAKDKCALGFKDGRLWVSYPEQTSTTNSSTLIYDVETERWFARRTGFGAYYNGSRFFFGGMRSGHAASLDDQLLEDGSHVSVAYQSEYIDCNLPDQEKTWGDLVIPHGLNNGLLTLAVRLNKQPAATIIRNLRSTVLQRETIPLVNAAGAPLKSYSIAIRLSGTGAAGGFSYVDSPILLHYYIEARKGRTFDTGITNHGTEDVKTVDQVEIDVDASLGPATLEVWSDLPGGDVTSRFTQAIAQTGGREIVELVFATPVDGKLLRYRITSDFEFAVYGFRASGLLIGVYLDGAQGEVWDTQPLAIGV